MVKLQYFNKNKVASTMNIAVIKSLEEKARILEPSADQRAMAIDRVHRNVAVPAARSGVLATTPTK